MYKLIALFSMLSCLIGFSKFLKFRELVEDNDGKIDDKAKNNYFFSIYVLLIAIGMLISSFFMYILEKDDRK